jgi:hypothetical protein
VNRSGLVREWFANKYLIIIEAVKGGSNLPTWHLVRKASLLLDAVFFRRRAFHRRAVEAFRDRFLDGLPLLHAHHMLIGSTHLLFVRGYSLVHCRKNVSGGFRFHLFSLPVRVVIPD